MDQGKTALVVGATGLVGSHLLSLLVEDEFYSKVKVLARHRPEINHPKVEVIINDFQDLQSSSHHLRADDIYCCLGTTRKKAGSKEAFYKVDFHYPLEIAKITQQQGATHFFLVSAMGADVKSNIFYNRVKGEIEVAISTIPFQSINVFRPSLLLGHRKERRMGESIAKWFSLLFAFMFVGPFKKYKPIHAQTVAQGMLKIARQELDGFYIFESEQIKRI